MSGASGQTGQEALIQAPSSGRTRLLVGGALLAASGIGVAASVVPEILNIGRSGFGLVQGCVLLVSLALMVHGLEMASPTGAQAYTALTAVLSDLSALRRLAIIGVQLLLVALIVRLFQIENPAFYSDVVPLTVVGFVLHHLVPPGWRQPYFVALSLIAFLIVLGAAGASWLVGIVSIFVAILHAPVSPPVRIALLLLVGAALAYLRGSDITTPWSAAIWPVLGSILMFRLIVYIYDQRHAKTPIRLRETLAYLFLLPNVVFPLFPVVDFATFRRTYYDRDAFSIYQQGVRWMLRGLTHLLVYRVIYQFWTLAPSEVATTGDVVRYMLATFGLYLRVSGQFHLVVGMLHLFGYRLPETHHLFYLASSFTDFWRRINIYWKDFMLKVVFNPVYFPLRKAWGETTALLLATVTVFFTTWVAHAYQWFWILGSWLLSWTDALFWAVLALLFVSNSLYESKKGRRRVLPGAVMKPREALGLALTTIATFTTICVLWSFWGSDSIGEWLDLLSVRMPTIPELGGTAAVLCSIGVLGVWAHHRERRRGRARLDGRVEGARAALPTVVALVLLYAAGRPETPRLLGVRAQEIAREVRVPELNRRDVANLTRGYYESLTGVGQKNSHLWELYAERPDDGANIWASGVLRERDDFLAREMVPLFGIHQRGLQFRTNRWGMRDRDYEQLPAPGVQRIAVLGQSYVAGDGVGDGETFEQLVEDRLNRERAGNSGGFEILNFAVGSYSILQQVILLERVLTFQPHMVILVVGPGDEQRVLLHIVQQVQRRVRPPWPWLEAMVESAAITPEMREAEAQSRLKPYGRAIVDRAYRAIVDTCRQRGIVPVWIYLATPDRAPSTDAVRGMIEQARSAGFEAIDLSDVYSGGDLAIYRVSPWDFHPNARGHGVIAERLYWELTTNPRILQDDEALDR